jgi:hypothetical protein
MAVKKSTAAPAPAPEGDAARPNLTDRLEFALEATYQLETLISRLDAEIDERDADGTAGRGEVAVVKLLIGRCHALTDALIGLCDHDSHTDLDQDRAEFNTCASTVMSIFGEIQTPEPAAS